MRVPAAVGIVSLLVAGFVTGFVWLAVPGGPAAAGTASDFAKSENADLVKYVQGGAALNLRLLAMEALRARAGSTSDLVTVAKCFLRRNSFLIWR